MSESPFLKIALVGAGKVASHLGTALIRSGIKVTFVVNRSDERGFRLAQALGAEFTTTVNAIANSDLIIIAVTDDAIPIIAKQLKGCNCPVVHTSGTLSQTVLSEVGESHGVFYPLQTFSEGRKVDFSKIPICLSASNQLFAKKLEELAHLLSDQVYSLDDAQRKILHLAAVFANNFTNYLYSVSSSILNEHGLAFELLLPLIEETASKIQTIPPFDAQTGPARRGDFITIEQHKELLSHSPKELAMYNMLTENILKQYSQVASERNERSDSKP